MHKKNIIFYILILWVGFISNSFSLEDHPSIYYNLDGSIRDLQAEADEYCATFSLPAVYLNTIHKTPYDYVDYGCISGGNIIYRRRFLADWVKPIPKYDIEKNNGKECDSSPSPYVGL